MQCLVFILLQMILMQCLTRQILLQKKPPRPVKIRMMSSAGNNEDEILFKTENNTCFVTLNKPKALNALTVNMVDKLDSQLRRWRRDDSVKAIVVEGAGGKAFCAGGDIRAITREKDSQLQRDFFRAEYRLDHLTSVLPRYVALVDGIVMGGGVGISVHAPNTVATERTVFAMPETGIGLVPDVGGAFFLPRLKQGPALGTYLGLTGERLKGADCLHAGVADHFCPSENLDALKQALVNMEGTADIASVIESYSKPLESCPPFSLDPLLPNIERAFSKDTVEEILSELDSIGDEWAAKMSSKLRKVSPTSLKVSLRQMREGATKSDLKEALKMEYRLVRRCIQDNDFYEGVRALIVDKDNSPKWRPASIDEVTDETVERYFSPLSDELEFDE